MRMRRVSFLSETCSACQSWKGVVGAFGEFLQLVVSDAAMSLGGADAGFVEGFGEAVDGGAIEERDVLLEGRTTYLPTTNQKVGCSSQPGHHPSFSSSPISAVFSRHTSPRQTRRHSD
jgi:hypothetical protein